MYHLRKFGHRTIQIPKRFYCPRKPRNSPDTAAKSSQHSKKFSGNAKRLSASKALKDKLEYLSSLDYEDVFPKDSIWWSKFSSKNSSDNVNIVNTDNLVSQSAKDQIFYSLRSMYLRSTFITKDTDDISSKSNISDRIFVLYCSSAGSNEVLSAIVEESARKLGIQSAKIDCADILYSVEMLRRIRGKPLNSERRGFPVLIEESDINDDANSSSSEESVNNVRDMEDSVFDWVKELQDGFQGSNSKPMKGLMVMTANSSEDNLSSIGDDIEKSLNILVQYLEAKRVIGRQKSRDPLLVTISNLAALKHDKLRFIKNLQKVLHKKNIIATCLDDGSSSKYLEFLPKVSSVSVQPSDSPEWKISLERGIKNQVAKQNWAVFNLAAAEFGLQMPDFSEVHAKLCQSPISRSDSLKILTIAHGMSKNMNSKVIGVNELNKAFEINHESEKTLSEGTAGKESSKFSLIKQLNSRPGLKFDKYEKKLFPCIIPPNEVRTKFKDIVCSLKVKETLQSLISLPLIRPELFYGALQDSMSGILMFGPPGTGKTMLAKAIASQCRSNFLSISPSSIYDMYVGEGEKNAKAVFSLARKIRPCVIFIDELDALLDSRDNIRTNSTKREVINEFMAAWDGVLSDNRQIMVVGATNRPFDLDDAVLRRLPRRIQIDLPGFNERKSILKVHLKGENVADGILDQVAGLTESYSGSDLKNLCISAALYAVREQLSPNDNNSGILNEFGELSIQENPEKTKLNRSLNIDHFKKALDDIGPSVSDSQESLEKLKQWNNLYGEVKGARNVSKFGFK